MCVSILTPTIFRSSRPVFYPIDRQRRFWTARGIEAYEVEIGAHAGVQAKQVGAALAEFDRKLAAQLQWLDREITSRHAEPTQDGVQAVIILCAWAHAEWVRIHPLPNGNGRTARLLVNSIAQRYGLPAFMRLRPRPGTAYAHAAHEAMEGNWRASIALFLRLYAQTL
jgi:hypothetical protein